MCICNEVNDLYYMPWILIHVQFTEKGSEMKWRSGVNYRGTIINYIHINVFSTNNIKIKFFITSIKKMKKLYTRVPVVPTLVSYTILFKITVLDNVVWKWKMLCSDFEYSNWLNTTYILLYTNLYYHFYHFIKSSL